MTPHRWFASIALALGIALLMSGCQHCCKRASCPPPPTNGPPGPVMGNQYIPPQHLAPLEPTPSTGMKPEVLLPATPPQPPATSSKLLPDAQRGQTKLGEPDFGVPAAPLEPNKAPVVVPPPEPKKAPPPIVEESSIAPLPVGIASFAQVKDGVSNGLRPNHLDGIDWLKAKGYKTVINLRSGKEDDSSDRKQFENRGLKYYNLTVSPETINPTLVTEFNRLVNDADGRPVFVYDLDGKRAGAMWYLYFRTSELLSNDVAIVRAGRFGLKEKGDAEQTQLWTAVQKYLTERNP